MKSDVIGVNSDMKLISVFREQRQKDASNKAVVVNTFPKDRDYRQEAMQANAASAVTAMSKNPASPELTAVHFNMINRFNVVFEHFSPGWKNVSRI